MYISSFIIYCATRSVAPRQSVGHFASVQYKYSSHEYIVYSFMDVIRIRCVHSHIHAIDIHVWAYVRYMVYQAIACVILFNNQ